MPVIGSDEDYIDDASFLYVGHEMAKQLDEGWWDDSQYLINLETIYPHQVDNLEPSGKGITELTLKELVMFSTGTVVDRP